MKIERAAKMVRYDSLNCGDVFLADGAVWMRTDSYEAAVVNLETGIADDCFDSDEIVELWMPKGKGAESWA